ncbi:Ribokinase [subsurface metagenome]
MDTSYIFFDQELASGVAPIMVDDEGQNTIVIVPGANDNLLPSDIRRAERVIRSADILVCQMEIPLETSIVAMRIAKDAGVRTIFNPAPARALPQEIIELSEIIAPNETETEILTGIAVKSLEDAEAAARKLRNMGASVVVITLGARGVLVVSEEEIAHIPARKTKAVDTAGAGANMEVIAHIFDEKVIAPIGFLIIYRRRA